MNQIESSVRLCKTCGAKMRLKKNGERNPQYRCQPCHTRNVREKYKESSRRAVAKYRKTKPERVAELRAKSALRICGVASCTSVRSKRSEKNASNARQRWTIEGDELVLSGQHTDSQLAKMLGRSIRAIQRRLDKLRKPEGPNIGSPTCAALPE